MTLKQDQEGIELDAAVLRKLERHFDNIAQAYYDIVDSIWYEHGYFHSRESQFLHASIESKTLFAVDAGCGPGRHTATLANFAERVIALDISREMLALARKVTLSSAAELGFVQADVRHIPIKPAVATLVVNLEVLEHLPGGREGISAALRELRRILFPGGKLVTEVPLRLHGYVNLLCPPSLTELQTGVVKSYYERAPLIVEEYQNDKGIEKQLECQGFSVKMKAYVRVLPSGLIERFPGLVRVDVILERVPFVRRLAREVMWLVEAV